MSDEHVARARTLLPSRDESWRQFLEELSYYGTLSEDASGRIVLAKQGGPHTMTFALSAEDFWSLLVQELASDLAQGKTTNGWTIIPQWLCDDILELIGSRGEPFVVIDGGELVPATYAPGESPTAPPS